MVCPRVPFPFHCDRVRRCLVDDSAHRVREIPSSRLHDSTTVRFRALALVAMALALAACTSAPTASSTTPTVPAQPLSAIDLSATPTGWVPVAYGDAQISVPWYWWVVYDLVTCPSGLLPGQLPPGLVYVVPPGHSYRCPAIAKPVSIIVLEAPTRPAAAYQHHEFVNGIEVFYSGDVYAAPSAGVQGSQVSLSCWTLTGLCS